jgi:transcription elongation factor Elf1
MQQEEWFKCPICGQKILKISHNAQAQGIYIKCKKCKNIIEITVPNPNPEPVSV